MAEETVDIPDPPEDVPLAADENTAKELADIRKHPVVSQIMFVIGAIGFVLWAISGILQYANHKPDKPTLALAPETTIETADKVGWIDWCWSWVDWCWSWVESDPSALYAQIQDFLFGLGIELTASAFLIYFFVYVYSNASNKLRPVQYVLGISTVLAVLSICLKNDFAIVSLESVCIEVIGAMVVFVVLDNVVDALTDKSSDS